MTARIDSWLRTALTAVLLALLAAGGLSATSARDVRHGVWSLRLSPDARHLAVIHDDAVALYEPGGAGHIWDIPGCRRVAFAPDGTSVAVATPEKICIVERAHGTTIVEFPIEQDWTTSIAFSPDGRFVAALADHLNTLQLWDLSSGALRWSVEAHEDADYAVAFSPDGRMIATGGSDTGVMTSQIRLWDSERGDLLQTIVRDRHEHVREATFIEAGRALMVGNTVYDLTNLERIEEKVDHPLAGLKGRVVLSPDGRLAAAARRTDDTWLQALTVVDLAGDNAVLLETGGSRGLYWDAVFGPDGQSLSVATSDGTVTIWDLASGRATARFDGNRRPRRAPHWAAIGLAALAWLLAWGLVIVVCRRHALEDADWWLVPAGALCAGFVIITLHWIHVADPWICPDPLGTLQALAMFEIICLVLLLALSISIGSWRSLFTPTAVIPGLLLVTAGMWLEIVVNV
ncbi:MAG: WD40 repeat domain-containing protein [Phycisphaerales bacterium]|nr:WD40 repeat domain-containing protein [Phycisphaerales bacterium]